MQHKSRGGNRGDSGSFDKYLVTRDNSDIARFGERKCSPDGDVDGILALLHEASPSQLQLLLHQGIWQPPQGGELERLNSESILRWLEVLLEGGDEFAAQKLEEAGDEFIDSVLVCFCLVRSEEFVARAFVSWDDSEVEELRNSATHIDLTFGEFLISALGDNPEAWGIIRRVLTMLQEEKPEFLTAALARAEDKPSPDGFESHLHAAQPSESDVREDDLLYAHERFMSQRGFVTAYEAREFLVRARQLNLGELERSVLGNSDESVVQLVPAQATRSVYLRMEEALGGLEGVEALNRAVGDLAYVANVLMAGASCRRQPLVESLAAEVAMATCQLGLSWFVDASRSGVGSAGEDVRVLAREGVRNLFSVGWHLLCFRVLPRSAEALDKLLGVACRQPAAHGHEAWIRREILRDLAHNPVRKRLHAGDWESVEELLGIIGCVLTAEMSQLFSELLCEIPRLSLLVEQETEAVSGNVRFFACLHDVELLEQELEKIHRLTELIR